MSTGSLPHSPTPNPEESPMKKNPLSTARAASSKRPAKAASAERLTLGGRRLWIVVGLGLVIAAIAQVIGPIAIPLGIAAVTLLPMIWGLLGGIVVSGQRRRPMPIDLQHAAGAVMAAAVLFVVVKLGFTIGPVIPDLIQVGPALMLQEVGHLFGTILFALPLAVLLKMGPATIGATFSIDRESSFAMVSERYGTETPQYRGVLAMYTFGAIFGALIASVIASFTASLGIFDPTALAMGAGIGSASMMVGAVAAIDLVHPGMNDHLLALATTSNLITVFLGVYVGVWVALPLAERFYRLLTRNKDHIPKLSEIGTLNEQSAPAVDEEPGKATVPLWSTLPIVVLVGLVVSIIGARGVSWSMLVSYALLAVVMAAGVYLSKLTRGKIPAIATVITLAIVLSSPISPIAGWIIAVTKSIDLIPILTMLLTFAGLSMGKDLPVLRSIGWKIIPVGIVAISSSFILGTVIAEFVLGAWG
jgi:hypothetical protein